MDSFLVSRLTGSAASGHVDDHVRPCRANQIARAGIAGRIARDLALIVADMQVNDRGAGLMRGKGSLGDLFDTDRNGGIVLLGRP